MTLGEGKRKVLMLMDEYSSSGTLTVDEDLNIRMADFFDLAQKNISAYKKIIRSFVPAKPLTDDSPAAGMVACPAPDDLIQPFRVWRDGKVTRAYAWTDKAILLPEDVIGHVVVEYFATPATIPQNAPDDYEFEVSDDAAACMPYYVAAQQLVVDLVVDFQPLLDMYDRMVSSLDLSLPEMGGNGVKQSFYSCGRRRGTWPVVQA